MKRFVIPKLATAFVLGSLAVAAVEARAPFMAQMQRQTHSIRERWKLRPGPKTTLTRETPPCNVF